MWSFPLLDIQAGAQAQEVITKETTPLVTTLITPDKQSWQLNGKIWIQLLEQGAKLIKQLKQCCYQIAQKCYNEYARVRDDGDRWTMFWWTENYVQSSETIITFWDNNNNYNYNIHNSATLIALI